MKAGPGWLVIFYGRTHSRLQNEQCIIPAKLTLFASEAAMYTGPFCAGKASELTNNSAEYAKQLVPTLPVALTIPQGLFQ